MDKPLSPPLDPLVSTEPTEEPAHSDLSQGSEFLNDAIRMVEQPLELPNKQ